MCVYVIYTQAIHSDVVLLYVCVYVTHTQAIYMVI